jgi:hypothetical protein
MGKKASGKQYTSKGERNCVSGSIRSQMRAAKDSGEKMLDKQRAWAKGSNPWITIENPNKAQTNKKFIRVRMNDLMRGSCKEREKNLYVMK